LTGYNV